MVRSVTTLLCLHFNLLYGDVTYESTSSFRCVFPCPADYELSLFRHAWRETKSQEKLATWNPGGETHLLAPRILRGHFFNRGFFFRVTHDGLSERETSRSLHAQLKKNKAGRHFGELSVLSTEYSNERGKCNEFRSTQIAFLYSRRF